MQTAWQDRTPSRRCDWIDQLRGWAVIVMIEVHVVNVYLHKGLIPEWLNFLNGLVAPSFITCAGYSLVLGTFRPDGTLRPFWPDTARRLGFILLCAYLLHAPGLTVADWTVLSTTQKFRELFKIDVLQAIVFSLLILQGLARLVRRPLAFAGAAFLLAVGVAWASPRMWQPGVADGFFLPLRGLFNGNTDRGVTALFPLFPWLSFAAFGAVLGTLYREVRVLAEEGRARWSEVQWLSALGVLGVALLIWGTAFAGTWLKGTMPEPETWRLHNTTLPSIAQRLGWVSLAGSFLGFLERFRGKLPGPNVVEAASRESLLLYMLHLIMIFGVMLTPPVKAFTGWEWYSLGWTGTLALTVFVIGLNLLAGLGLQHLRTTPERLRGFQRRAALALCGWALVGGWLSFWHFRKSPELAIEPYPFLNAARVKKGLAPTPDGLEPDPAARAREKARRGMRLNEEERRLVGPAR